MAISSFGWLGIYSAAFLLGIAHSLEPGHGKTVVAAYLVGSRGRRLDALILGITVTFTHTFSIIVLGVIAKISAKYYTEQQIHGWLGMVASLIILGIGIWMVKTRWSALADPSKGHHHFHLFGHGHDHGRGHGHDHGHSHGQDHGHSHAEAATHVHDVQAVHDHAHDHAHHPHAPEALAAGTHRHEDGTVHPDHLPEGHTHTAAHDHDHDHGHQHHGHSHGVPADGKPVGLAALILLGISGGIVPCPAALAILLASASVGNLGKGLALTLIFSLGLALSLVAIGMVIVSGVKGAERFVDTEKFAPQVAFASALIVTCVGAYTFYSSLGHLGLV